MNTLLFAANMPTEDERLAEYFAGVRRSVERLNVRRNLWAVIDEVVDRFGLLPAEEMDAHAER